MRSQVARNNPTGTRPRSAKNRMMESGAMRRLTRRPPRLWNLVRQDGSLRLFYSAREALVECQDLARNNRPGHSLLGKPTTAPAQVRRKRGVRKHPQDGLCGCLWGCLRRQANGIRFDQAADCHRPSPAMI